MSNKIIFTQDVLGEREWLESKFPNFINYQSEFSRKWPSSVPTEQGVDAIWEIPPDSKINVESNTFETYKSLYTTDQKFIHDRWVDADHLLIKNLTFSQVPKSAKAQVLTFTRTGTVFLESILYGGSNPIYTKDTKWNTSDPFTPDHHTFGEYEAGQLLYNTVLNSQPDIFFTYRTDWWGWFTSVIISHQEFHYHYNDNVAWEHKEPFVITVDDFKKIDNIVQANWIGTCDFRTKFPNLNFYMFEYSDLIKHQALTDHKKINYDKTKLISNYNDAKSYFTTHYLPKFLLWEQRCISHLKTMGCQQLTNFDLFLN